MGWTAKPYRPEASLFDNFRFVEGVGENEIEFWRIKDDNVHFATRDVNGTLFTAIAYTSRSIPRSSTQEMFAVKVVDMSMGFTEPLHPHVQKYYDEHCEP